MIEAFLFDLGNVLVHFSHERMCRQMSEICGIPPLELRRFLFDSGLQAEFECGRLSEAAMHHRLEQRAGRSLDVAALIHAASDIFERNTGIESVIDALHAQGHRLVLLSNTSISHFQFVRSRFHVLSRFDAFVLSYEVGAMKPANAIFEAAVAAAGCSAERCFYTDDIAAYVAAGRRHGLQAEVYTSVEALLTHLSEVGVDLTLAESL